MQRLIRLALAEAFGTAVLVAVVIGSGLMGSTLTADLGIVLLINAASTVLALGLLILVLAPVSGAQFNPVLSLALVLRKELPAAEAGVVVAGQLIGAIAGAALANLMFNRAALQLASADRVNPGSLLGEVVATAGLLALILVLVDRDQARLLPLAVPAWIGAAYFFTSSTSFANPAVTLGRMFSDSFAGIGPVAVLPFIAAQLLGGALGLLIARGLREPAPIHPASTPEETHV